MLKIGDTVKVLSTTEVDGKQKELIRLGSICIILSVQKDVNGCYHYGIADTQFHGKSINGYYLENELEKGHLEWIRE